MLGKLMVLAGGGYLLGTRAGREQLDKAKARLSQLSQDPKVRGQAQRVDDLVKDKAPGVHQKVHSAAATSTGSTGGAAGSPLDTGDTDVDNDTGWVSGGTGGTESGWVETPDDGTTSR